MGVAQDMATQRKRSLTPSEKHSGDEINWEGRHDYMTIKRKKLRSQVEQLGDQKSTIFEGVTIYVNGFTDPNADELKEKIYHYGGLYEYALTSRVTHVIATNLPTAKIRNLSTSAVVCKPDWIVDSIKNGDLLPIDSYLLYKPSRQQRKILFGRVNPAADDLTVHKDDSIKIEPAPHHDHIHSSSISTDSKDFVSEFYSHSRLHYLSTWSRELKEFTNIVLPTAKQIIPRLKDEESLKGRGTHAIVHVDIDCFFVSVSLLDKPHLKGKPIAVTHAKPSPTKQQKEATNRNSTSDIASCSYEARQAGVKNGMSVGSALSKCPDLVLVSYDFEKYRSVSQRLYEILISYSHQVEAVSCDEAFIELTEYATDTRDVLEIVKHLREEILVKTGCNASAGVSHNKLLARLATRKAKPNGQFLLTEDKVMSYLTDQPVNSLPGVGWALSKKLQDYGIQTCGQLQSVPLETLREQYGSKTGEMLYCYCRGTDSRELKLSHEKKSLSVDINFGIRFKELSEGEGLLLQLGKELERRAAESSVRGECICLKLKIRKPTASSKTKKYLGHGPCDNVSRSFNLLMPTQNGAEIGRIACRLLKQVNPVASDIRGMGIQLTKLVSQTSQSCTKPETKDIRSLMNKASSSKNTLNESPIPSFEGSLISNAQHCSKGGATSNSLNQSLYSLPPLDDLDESVLLALPPDLQDKILNEYSSKPFKEETTKKPAEFKESGISNFQRRVEASNHIQQQRFATIDRITFNIQDRYVADLRSNLRIWVAKSRSGPTQAERDSFSSYVCWLTEVNIEVVYLALKCLKRVIVSKQLVKEWSSLFNSCLAIVQNKLQTNMSSRLVLDIAPLCENSC